MQGQLQCRGNGGEGGGLRSSPRLFRQERREWSARGPGLICTQRACCCCRSSTGFEDKENEGGGGACGHPLETRGMDEGAAETGGGTGSGCGPPHGGLWRGVGGDRAETERAAKVHGEAEGLRASLAGLTGRVARVALEVEEVFKNLAEAEKELGWKEIEEVERVEGEGEEVEVECTIIKPACGKRNLRILIIVMWRMWSSRGCEHRIGSSPYTSGGHQLTTPNWLFNVQCKS